MSTKPAMTNAARIERLERAVAQLAAQLWPVDQTFSGPRERARFANAAPDADAIKAEVQAAPLERRKTEVPA